MTGTATLTVEGAAPKAKWVIPVPPIKIESSLFTMPPEQLTIAFQRAVGMAAGKIISIDEKGQGVIEIDGYRYEFADGRYKKYLKLMAGLEIQFSFWPTASKKRLKSQEPGDPPHLKLSSIRKVLPEPGAVEVIGCVHKVRDDFFLVRLFSKEKKKDYFVTLTGKFEGQQGDYVQAIAKLAAGEIRYISHTLLYRKN